MRRERSWRCGRVGKEGGGEEGREGRRVHMYRYVTKLSDGKRRKREHRREERAAAMPPRWVKACGVWMTPSYYIGITDRTTITNLTLV